ncbi:MAG: tetratricopeptide repeat protein [Bacteroidetes bacterium]|nr:tetratricopeptide repeat protein [Bacteroidota bacterium]
MAFSSAQSAETPDSLLNELYNSEPDDKARILNELSGFYTGNDFDKTLEYATLALDAAQKNGDMNEEAKAWSNTASVFYDRNEFDTAMTLYTRALDVYTTAGDKEGISGTLKMLGNLCIYLGRYDKGLGYYAEVLSYEETREDFDGMAGTYNNIGIIHYYRGDYDKTVGYFTKALDIYRKLENEDGIAGAENNIANVYKDWGKTSKALEYFDKSLETYRKLGDKEGIAGTLLNIGWVYEALEEFDTALVYYKESLKIREDIGEQSGIAVSLNNIGNVFSMTGKYSKALKYYQRALKIEQNIGYREGEARTLSDLGVVAKEMMDYEKSLDYLEQSMEIVNELGYSTIMLTVYKTFSEIYLLTGNRRLAYESFKKHITVKDSLFTEESHRQLTEMQTRYETEKKEKEIELLTKNKALQELALEKRYEELRKQRIVIFTFVFCMIVVLIFSGLTYFQFRAKQRANIVLASQNDEILQQKEEITAQRDQIELHRNEIEKQRDEVTFQRDIISVQKQDILDSIHYANRIQRAILPPEGALTNGLLEHFIVFLPKDIISGDFYWATTISVETHGRMSLPIMVVAVADCKEHGVPGAFMSMLGITLLNEIAAEGIHTPAEILGMLRKKISTSLHRKGKGNEAGTDTDRTDTVVSEGIEMALCSLDLSTNKLQFAGANNPLYIIRNPDPQGYVIKSNCQFNGTGHEQGNLAGQGIIEIKGDKMPGAVHPGIKPFTNHELQLHTGDMVYIFSDGFANQLGAVRGGQGDSTSGHDRFRELLLSVSHKTPEQQKNVLTGAINEFKAVTDRTSGGEYGQTDDIVVIGLKIG